MATAVRKGGAETFFKQEFQGETLRAFFSKDRGPGIVRILHGKAQKCQISLRHTGTKEAAGAMAAKLCTMVLDGSLQLGDMSMSRDELLKDMPAPTSPPAAAAAPSAPSEPPKRKRAKATAAPSAPASVCKRPAAAVAADESMHEEDQIEDDAGEEGEEEEEEAEEE